MEQDTDLGSRAHDDEIDLGELFVVLWAGKREIIIGALLSALLAVSYSLYLPDKYTSEALLAPRNDGGTGGALGQLASQYGGLAGLAGVNFGGVGEQGKTAIAIEMLKSRDFFGRYLYEQVLVDLMASTSWERESNEVLIDQELYDLKTQAWVREVSAQFKVKPSVQEAHEAFMEKFFSVTEDKQSRFVTVSVTHFSPNVARDWALKIVASVNEAVRAREVKEAENSIAFLNAQSSKTSLVSLNAVFAELIEQQTKTVMLANASDEYVFQVIDPPVAAELKSEPKRALICVLGVLLGSMLAVILVLFRHYVIKKPARFLES